jgi:predicted N-formylglutamate amidohydrolase
MGRCSVRARSLLLTCEHGGNRIPPRYAWAFRGARQVLASHAGYDLGALSLARRLSRRLGVSLSGATVSRLLVDLNRSTDHPRLFSAYTAGLDAGERRRIIERYYLPHRDRVEERVRCLVENGEPVLHVAVHSFVPALNGTTRCADVGLLYDPARRGERRLCRSWADALRREAPSLRVRFNYPYRGTGDGLTTFLRRRFGAGQYWGIELEVNQKHLTATGTTRRVQRVIGDSLERLVGKSIVNSR